MYENKKTKATIMFQGFIILACFLLMAICVFPLLNVIATSLSSPEAILKGEVVLLPVGTNFDAYRRVIMGTRFLKSFRFTVILTLGYTAVSMLLTVLCAYPLSRTYLKGRNIIMFFILFTMYFDAGIIPNYLVIKDLKMLDTVWALLFPAMLSAYNMIIMRNFLQVIDASILESASIDGCSEAGLLLRIVLPLSTPVLATLSLFYAVSRWNMVSDAIFYISDPNKYPLQSVLREIIMSEQASALDVGQSSGLSKTVSDSVKSASVVLSTLPILCIYPFIQKYFTKGIMLGSVKG